MVGHFDTLRAVLRTCEESPDAAAHQLGMVLRYMKLPDEQRVCVTGRVVLVNCGSPREDVAGAWLGIALCLTQRLALDLPVAGISLAAYEAWQHRPRRSRSSTLKCVG